MFLVGGCGLSMVATTGKACLIHIIENVYFKWVLLILFS